MGKPQLCCLCYHRSLPGLTKGHGLCRYHWNLGLWGRDWAVMIEHEDALEEDRRRIGDLPQVPP